MKAKDRFVSGEGVGTKHKKRAIEAKKVIEFYFISPANDAIKSQTSRQELSGKNA